MTGPDERNIDLGWYERAAAETDVSPEAARHWYYAMGLAGEAGELANKVKKEARDGVISDVMIAAELGDILWYLVREANRRGYTLAGIARMNVEKLGVRQRAGTLRGSGDNR